MSRWVRWLRERPHPAADLAVKAPPLAPPVYDWSGLYIGGYGFGNQNINNATGPVGFANFMAKLQDAWPAANQSGRP